MSHQSTRLELYNNPGYPTTNPGYIGTIHHSKHGVAASINCDYKSHLSIRRYLCGLNSANYPVPAIRYKVTHYASGDCIEIRSWKGSISKGLIDKIYWKPV